MFYFLMIIHCREKKDLLWLSQVQLAWSVIKVINKSIYLRISDMVVIECTAVAGSRPTIFSWEPALWPLNSQERVMVMMWKSQKNIAIFGNKQRLLSIDMKTKVVQHVERVWMRVWEWVLSIEMKTKVVQHVPRINLSHSNF